MAASGSSVGAPYTETIIRVIVGRWKALRQSVSQLEDDPQRSGVFARFAKDGSSLDLLDAAGEPRATVEPGDGTGLVAALFPRTDQLAWVVTGLDDERRRRRGAAPLDARDAAQRLRRRGERRRGGEAAADRQRRATCSEARADLPPALDSAARRARRRRGARSASRSRSPAALYVNPIVLAAVLAATLLAGAAAKVARELWLSVRLALPFALLVAIVNPLVYQGGETLLVRGPVILGHRFDITLEAFVQGGLNGLRVAAIIVAFGLLSAAVDPDELLRLFRRLSYRSALTASLATRLVPVLERDALRRGDAARCRPEPPGRLAMTRLVLAGTLDRAVDMAAALEVRGYALAGRPASGSRARWSRHDVRFALAATRDRRARDRRARWLAWAPSTAIRRSTSTRARQTLALAAALPLLALAPFAGRAARMGVRRD